jgi:hypothetical protein
MKTDAEANINPEYYKFNTTDIEVYLDADVNKKAVLVTKEIDDQGDKWCRIKYRGVAVPEEFLAAGYKIEGYCCVQFRVKGATTTMCNVNRPRCWYEMRKFARLIRKYCIISKHGADDASPMLKEEK